MICISVTPSSRTLAPADLLNASRKCDMIELCVDHFLKTPDIGEMVKLVDKPILVSCRRERDGGQWTGSEEDRLQLLRNAIIAGPAYIEIELDIADKIPRFGDTKRVISHTSLNRPLAKIDDVFEQCWKAKADVVKFTWPTDDLDAAWPLLAAVSQARELPVVGKGIGRSGLTFSLLGQRYGCPWIYAALERGMEAFPGQPTVWQLEEEYGWRDIQKKTRFLGVVGMGAAENTTTRILNSAFQEFDKPIRCLPLIPGSTDRLNKMLNVLKINALIVDPMFSSNLVDFGEPDDEIAERSGYMDLFMAKNTGWKGSATLFPALETVAAKMRGDTRWAQGRATTIIGSGQLAKAATLWANTQNAAISLSAPSDNSAMTVAKACEVRHLPWNAVHTTHADVVILAGPEIKCGNQRGELNPTLIREGTTVIDLTCYPEDSAFADESRIRGAHYIDPSSIFSEQLQYQFRKLVGRDIPSRAFARAMNPG